MNLSKTLDLAHCINCGSISLTCSQSVFGGFRIICKTCGDLGPTKTSMIAAANAWNGQRPPIVKVITKKGTHNEVSTNRP